MPHLPWLWVVGRDAPCAIFAGRDRAQARRERERSNDDIRMTPGLGLFYRGQTRMSVIKILCCWINFDAKER